MIPRIITRDVESALNRQAAVALIGPRQVGKTTLALEICADVDPARAFVVHAGDDRYPVSEGVEGIGVRALATELRARS